MRYQVIVGNVGTVCDTNRHSLAVAEFDAYVKQSKAGHGRAAGEMVSFMTDGRLTKEYYPEGF
jgi:hypothetical protein